jgi:pimeloyl-ACP methyl ester carboxylesterase
MLHAHLAEVSLAYRQLGAGDELVLIHGLAANHAFWQPGVLLPLGRDFHVTLFDLRGHGASSMPSAGYSAQNMADDLRRLLDHLEIERAHLVGHSIGGVVALQFALTHADRVRSLTIADSRIKSVQAVQRPEDWAHWQVARQRFLEVGLHVPPEINDWGLWLLEELAKPEWREAREKFKGTSFVAPFSHWKNGGRAAERWLQLLAETTARQDFRNFRGPSRDEIAGLACPLLAIYGALSTTLPSLEGLRALTRNCRSVLVPDADHFFPLSHGDVFVRSVREFLSECAPTPALPASQRRSA